MAERTSSMGSKTMLSRLLSQEPITGSDADIANTHEVNRQSTVKEIIIHVFFMSKYRLIGAPLSVGEAKSQYYRATGLSQAAHNAPGQILEGNSPIQESLTASDDLQLTVENLFGKTDDIHAKFNKADSRAEENGLRNALCLACNYIAREARTARFGRIELVYPSFASAFDIYKAAGTQAFRAAASRQRALMKPNHQDDIESRQETIDILNLYLSSLARSHSDHDTVLGLFPDDIWRQYAAVFK